MSARSAAQVGESPIDCANVVVGVGQDLLAQLLEVDREVRLLAGQRLAPGSPRGR